MPPRWLDKAALAQDPDLRRLQLRWASDDLWMRRAAFVLGAGALVAAAIVLALQPDAFARVAAGLIATGTTYLYGRHRRR